MNLLVWFATCLLAAVLKGQTTALCPFPGIPHKATALTRGKYWNWYDGQLFSHLESGEIVSFACATDWTLTSDQEANITCRPDGTWDRPPPRCYEIVTTKVAYNSKGHIWDAWIDDPNVWKTPRSQICQLTTDKLKVTASNGFPLILKVRPCPNTVIDSVNAEGLKCPRVSGSRTTGVQLYDCSQTKQARPQIEIMINIASWATIKREGYVQSVAVLRPAMSCGYPPVPVNGEFPKALRSPKSVTYKCKEGYQLVGQESNSCNTATVNWGSPPECRYKSTGVSLNPSTSSDEDASQNGDIDSTRSQTMGKSWMHLLVVVLLAIAVVILASCLLFIAKKKKRYCFKPSTSEQVVYSISRDVAERRDPSAEHAYENIIGLPVNQQPVYTEVTFQNGPGEQRSADQQPIYANVSKKRPKNNILSRALPSSDVVYASIRN